MEIKNIYKIYGHSQLYFYLLEKILAILVKNQFVLNTRCQFSF